jgi:hypothetical protein
MTDDVAVKPSHNRDSEEEGTRQFMVNIVQPQFNLHSEEANVSICTSFLLYTSIVNARSYSRYSPARFFTSFRSSSLSFIRHYHCSCSSLVDYGIQLVSSLKQPQMQI